MELDDLKHIWEATQTPTITQHTITQKMIDHMTQRKYTSKMKKIAYPEIIGTIICYLGVAYLMLHFNKLNTPFLQVLGIIVAVILLVLPAISLTMLWQFNKIGDVGQPYMETLKQFTAQKIRFYKFQQINAILSYVLLAVFIIIAPKLFGGNNINDHKYFWAFTLAFGYIFLYFFAKWGLKSYRKTLQQAETLLKELDT